MLTSYIIRNTATGEPIVETTRPKLADALRPEFEMVPVQQHLADLNNPSTAAYKWARRNLNPAA